MDSKLFHIEGKVISQTRILVWHATWFGAVGLFGDRLTQNSAFCLNQMTQKFTVMHTSYVCISVLRLICRPEALICDTLDAQRAMTCPHSVDSHHRNRGQGSHPLFHHSSVSLARAFSVNMARLPHTGVPHLSSGMLKGDCNALRSHARRQVHARACNCTEIPSGEHDACVYRSVCLP